MAIVYACVLSHYRALCDREQGLEQGREEALEQGLMQFVEIRFPTLITLAKQVIEQKIPLQQLQKLLYRTDTVEEAQKALNAKGL